MSDQQRQACSGPPNSDLAACPAAPPTHPHGVEPRGQWRGGRAHDKALYRVTDAMRLLSMSRTVIYEQIRSGRLRSVKQGRTRLIPALAITDYIALLEQEARST